MSQGQHESLRLDKFFLHFIHLFKILLCNKFFDNFIFAIALQIILILSNPFDNLNPKLFPFDNLNQKLFPLFSQHFNILSLK